MPNWDWTLDGWIVAAGMLCAVAAALLGNFLVLRRMSMLGDAITHAVLPGLAVAFFISNSRSSLPMFLGAVIVGILTGLLTEWIRDLGKVDEGASMGVVFTSLFALGLVMIVQAADKVHLDASCVLYGAIELTPLDTLPFAGYEIPRAVLVLGGVALVNAIFVASFFKELKISSFDPALANTTGFNARFLHYTLMSLVAVTAVASFESVGNILVVAMFIVPPATAYLLTNRLGWMIGISVILAAASAIFGHLGALIIPTWLGYQSTTTAGMMAVAAGLMLFLAVVFSPSHGILIKAIRQRLLAWRLLAQEILLFLYQTAEQDEQQSIQGKDLKRRLFASGPAWLIVTTWLQWKNRIRHQDRCYRITLQGRDDAQALIAAEQLESSI